MINQAKEIKLVPISEVKLNPRNRNKHPQEQIEQLVKIIQYQGFRRPITISNRSGVVSCGEGRYLAAKRMGLKEIPAMYQDYESEEQEYADGIADNAIDKQAILDLPTIHLDLSNLQPFDLDLLGLKDFKLEPDSKEGAKELSIDDFSNFDNQCPKCKFEWNDDE